MTRSAMSLNLKNDLSFYQYPGKKRVRGDEKSTKFSSIVKQQYHLVCYLHVVPRREHALLFNEIVLDCVV